MIFYVLTSMSMGITTAWDGTPYCLVGINRRCREIHNFIIKFHKRVIFIVI